MRLLVTGKKMSTKQHGFTFIEVLIVLFIFSVTFGLIVWHTGLFASDKQNVYKETTRLFGLMQVLQEKSLTHQTVYRLVVEDTRYQVQRYQQASNQWQNVTRPNLLRAYQISDGLRLQLHFAKPTQSSILFYPSGTLTPFTLTVSSEQGITTTLEGEFSGNLFVDDKALTQ